MRLGIGRKPTMKRGGPGKKRLSTPYYLLRKDVDRYLAAYDGYKPVKNIA